ncbi:MAG: YceI family protein [Bacteroidota bacterium]|nr:YceI family protein [Bacteroidota bacterium]
MAEDGHVEFLSNVPLHSFVGTSDQMVGRVDLAENIVDFYVDLNTLDTGIGKRDKDMRKTLETKEYPFAEFYGSFVMLPDSAISDEQPVEVQGNFTLHGVTLPINVSGSVEFSDTGLRVKAGWKLYLDDYEIDPPRLLLLKVDEEQAITLDMLLKPE